MKASTDKILTTHVGLLPTAPGAVEGAPMAETVRGVVHAQQERGVDIVNEGELTKGGIWVTYVNDRLTGFELADFGGSKALLEQGKDWKDFAEYYASRTIAPAGRMDWSCTGPVTYCGQAAVQREIDTLIASLGDTPVGDAFLTSTAPLSLEPGRKNEFYKSQEEFVFALADALSVEYEAIAASGLLVQVDDAWMAALWDRVGIEMGLEGYRKFCQLRVEALNHALRNVPADRVRYHLCWGSWHGPHAYDIPLKDIVDVLLSVNAQTYLFEAANVRHEHEYTVWQDVKLPDDKILAPGVVSHCTTLIEHPEPVSMRVQRFARIVGRERVIASTDCGLGLRCHPQIAWAKLQALGDGAALATKALWGGH